MKISIENKEAQWLIRLADTSVIIAQRMAELCSNGPTLEEDIALANVSLDCFGRAEELYKIVAKLDGDRYSADEYVYHRNEREYYNIKLAEQPNDDFAWTIARQFFHDVYVNEAFGQLENSPNSDLAALATKVLKEIQYNLNHTRDWMYRLGLGTEESNHRLQEAVDHIVKYIPEMFEWDDLDREFYPNCDQIEQNWNAEVNRVLSEINIERKETPELSIRNYRDGYHSEHMGHLLSIMQFLPRAYPDAKW